MTKRRRPQGKPRVNKTKPRPPPPTRLGGERPSTPPQANVLLVDDQPARLLSYEAVLSGLGVRCVRALSGHQALAALLKEEFAVIILDIQMPEMDGFEVARLLRAHPRYEQTPIIFATGVHVSELDQLKGYQAGAIDYLSIPIVPEVLRSKVAVLVELYHRRHELKLLNQALETARERGQAEHSQSMARGEAQFDRLFQHPTDLMAILRARRDKSGTIADWVLLNANENSLRFLRQSCAAPIGASLSEVIPQRASKVAALAARVLDTGEPLSYEDEVGDRAYLITMFRFDGDSVVSSASDITERKRAEAALRDNERRSRALIENAPVAVAHNAPDGRFEYVNKAFCTLLGYSAEELLERTWQELTHPEDLPIDLALGRKVLSGEMPFYTMQKRYLRRDGTSVWADFFGNFVRAESGEVLQGVAVAIDITERRDAQARLRESERQFRELANNIDQLAWTCNELGSADWYNDRWYQFTGTTFEEMRGAGWKKVHDPVHLKRVTASLQRSFETGEPWEDTFPLRGKDGRYRWFLSRATPIPDETGRIVRWFGTNTDVTEQRRMQEALLESDGRNDEFLAMLSHELRNPVAPIRNAAEVLARITTLDNNQAAMIGVIQRQTQHLSTLLDDLLDVARITKGRIALQREIISLSSCIEQAIETAEPEIRENRHELTVVHHHEPLHVNADRARLILCVANLLKNSAKYTPPGGEIRVQTYAELDQAVVQVTDNGRGISAALLPHVFDLFVQGDRSVDRAGGGLGIGLSVCKRLIEMHGGTVEARSPGSGLGATFAIRLPISPEHSTTQSAASGKTSRAAHRILIVDDNSDAADTLATLLKLEGYTARAAYSAEGAIEAATSFLPEVVLLDIGLPQMDGYAVALLLRESVPDARLIALTGYGQTQDKERSAAAGFDAHLVKPVGLTELDRLLNLP